MSEAPRTPMELIEGSGPPLAEEENALLLVRLRAATVLLSAGMALVVARDLLLGRGAIWPFQAAATVVMMALAALLSAARSGSGRGLRMAEAAAFGLTAAVVAVHLWHAQLSGTARGDATALEAGSKDAVIGTTIVLFIYALLVPAPHGHAWRSIAAIAACPVATEAILFLVHPEVFRMARQAATVQRVGETASLLLIATALAGYGAHVVRTMHVRAREARQFNQYRLRDEIGAGGVGEVYLAEHRLLKRPCALKLIRPERAGDPAALERFEREVRATALLSDPNTLAVYDYGRAEDGTCYYVMEYLDGLSLEELVARHGPMPPGRVIYLLRQACGALAEAHAAGLIHRDLKPANLFASRRGRRHDFLKLLDFGLVDVVGARHEAGSGRDRTVCGTPEYMAPEQARGERSLDGRCDLYALGGVAYSLLTGHPPFRGTTSMEVMNAHIREPVVPPSHLRAEIPRDLEEVVLHCLAKDRDGRIPGAEELERALSACASAREWDAQKAADWWAEFEPPGSIPRPSG